MKDITPIIEELQHKCLALESRNSVLEQKNAELQLLVKYYEECHRLSQQKKFGASSEKTSPGQTELHLFDEAENEAKPKEPEPTLEAITYTRRKRERKREEDLSGLPVEQIGHTFPRRSGCALNAAARCM